jgi:hypothetical protein
VAEANELISNIDEVLDAGGFRIKEWISNSPLTDKESRDEVVLGANEESKVQKVLGTVWHPKQDQFSFAVKIEYPNALSNEATPTSTKSSKMTKRIILSKLAGIFLSHRSRNSHFGESEDRYTRALAARSKLG